MKTALEVEVDTASNVLHTRYLGKLAATHMKIGVQQFELLLPQLRAGFAVLADLTGLEAMELDCAPHLARIMDLCKAHGVGLVVRIIPDPHKDIGMNILSLIHYRGKVRIVTCSTLTEGEQALK